MNLTTYNPFNSFDQLAIGIALMVVLAVFGWRLLTGRPLRRTLPPDEIDAQAFEATSTSRPRASPPHLPKNQQP
ncbi:MAG: hypothetical protein AB8B88_10900 [Devosiaceae bacterium]